MLQQWRSDLFLRMELQYKAVEQQEFGTPEGEQKPISRLGPPCRPSARLQSCIAGIASAPLFYAVISLPLPRRLEPPGASRYGLFNPIMGCPNATPMTRLGPSGDGGKWLCMAGDSMQDPCISYSIGSAEDYGFEEAILKAS